jgi:5'-nucleotidase
MLVLLTNDDGVDAPGIRVLAEALGRHHEVWVVAPDGDRSGASHSITLGRPLRVKDRGGRVFAVEGTPADCTRVGVFGILPRRPDLVVSGINQGANLGTDVCFSGTAAAARHAALLGLKGLALSCHRYARPDDAQPLADLASASLDEWSRLCRPGTFWNVNAPPGPFSSIEVCLPGDLPYAFRAVRDSDDRELYRLEVGLGAPEAHHSPDWLAVHQGRVAMTAYAPLGIDPEGQATLAAWVSGSGPVCVG